MTGTNEPVNEELPRQPSARSSGIRLVIPWTFAAASLVLAFFVWDYAEILFASRHRAAAVALLNPNMRLTTAERELNRACYSTLYISSAGRPPQLQVTTCRRLPWTIQALRRAIPAWDFPEQIIGRMLAKTQFTVHGNASGTVAKVEAGPASHNQSF